MRYTQPKLTGTLDATTTIQGEKHGQNIEAVTHALTSGPSYQSEE